MIIDGLDQEGKSSGFRKTAVAALAKTQPQQTSLVGFIFLWMDFKNLHKSAHSWHKDLVLLGSHSCAKVSFYNCAVTSGTLLDLLPNFPELQTLEFRTYKAQSFIPTSVSDEDWDYVPYLQNLVLTLGVGDQCLEYPFGDHLPYNLRSLTLSGLNPIYHSRLLKALAQNNTLQCLYLIEFSLAKQDSLDSDFNRFLQMNDSITSLKLEACKVSPELVMAILSYPRFLELIFLRLPCEFPLNRLASSVRAVCREPNCPILTERIPQSRN